MSYPGQNIIITGGARGIGRCIARSLLKSPTATNYVYILDINEEELTYCATVHLKQYHDAARVGYAIVDLTDPTSVRTTIQKAATNFFPNKRIDVLVNDDRIAKPH